MSIPSSSKNVLLTQYDALRRARRSGGVQKNGRIFRLRTTKQFLTQARGFVQIVLTNFDQVIPGHQPFNLVEAKTARFIINDVVDALGARVLQFQDLVNLFLIFRNSRDDLHFAKKVPEFFERRAGIGRHCIGTKQRNSQHAAIEPRTVIAQNKHCFARLHADFFKPSRTGHHLLGVFRPCGFLPDPTLFFAKRDFRTVFRGVPRQNCADRVAARRLFLRQISHATLRYMPR